MEGRIPKALAWVGNHLRPVVGAELAVDIAGVGLDRVQREEKPGSDFLLTTTPHPTTIPLRFMAVGCSVLSPMLSCSNVTKSLSPRFRTY